MPNIFHNLAKSRTALRMLHSAASRFPHSIIRLFDYSIISLLAFAPAAARANSVWDAAEAGHITWSNATTNWLSNGDLVITYKTGNGSLHLPGFARVWALAVGGGGSGGAGCVSQSNYRGGAGGGGAGGYVENATLLLNGGSGADGDYSIVVGAGGPAKSNDARVVGNNGGNSSVTYKGSTVDGFPVALGGGGGGFAENLGYQPSTYQAILDAGGC